MFSLAHRGIPGRLPSSPGGVPPEAVPGPPVIPAVFHDFRIREASPDSSRRHPRIARPPLSEVLSGREPRTEPHQGGSVWERTADRTSPIRERTTDSTSPWGSVRERTTDRTLPRGTVRERTMDRTSPPSDGASVGAAMSYLPFGDVRPGSVAS